MTKPEKLTKSVLGDKGSDLPHAGNATAPGQELTDYTVRVDRDAGGRARLTFVHGGHNVAYVLDDAARRELGRALLEPDPDCAVCFLEPPAPRGSEDGPS